MHRDLLAGMIISALIHSGSLFGDRFFKPEAKAQAPVEPTSSFYLYDPPRFEPEEPDQPQDEPQDAKLDFTVPQIVDTPVAVLSDVFTQRVQPPPVDRRNLMPGILDKLANPGGDLGQTEIFDPRNLDQIPQPRFRVPPHYPFDMRREGIEGTVTVGFLVDPEGNVLNAGAISSTHAGFEAPAVQAVSKWKFRPGRKSGQAVTTRMQVPILFRLDR